MSSNLGTVVSIAALMMGEGAYAPSADEGRPASAPGRSDAMPPGLAAPAGHGLAFELRAEGVQIYACAGSSEGGGAAWVLRAPEATLVDARGARAGTHGAGPTWEALDGSTVVGAKVAAGPTEPAAVPWLLLRAASHGPRGGRMADVTFVQRIQTSGGVAPPEGCSAATVGTVVRVPYSAVYRFFRREGLPPDGESTVTPHGATRP
jgi:hypothetical protein